MGLLTYFLRRIALLRFTRAADSTGWQLLRAHIEEPRSARYRTRHSTAICARNELLPRQDGHFEIPASPADSGCAIGVIRSTIGVPLIESVVSRVGATKLGASRLLKPRDRRGRTTDGQEDFATNLE